jgi:hypothetical protein
MSCHCASADRLLGSAWARVDGEGAAWLVGSLKLGLAACVIGEPPSLPEGLLVKKGTVAPRRFQPALIDVAAAEICTTHSPESLECSLWYEVLQATRLRMCLSFLRLKLKSIAQQMQSSAVSWMWAWQVCDRPSLSLYLRDQVSRLGLAAERVSAILIV